MMPNVLSRRAGLHVDAPTVLSFLFWRVISLEVNIEFGALQALRSSSSFPSASSSSFASASSSSSSSSSYFFLIY